MCVYIYQLQKLGSFHRLPYTPNQKRHPSVAIVVQWNTHHFLQMRQLQGKEAFLPLNCSRCSIGCRCPRNVSRCPRSHQIPLEHSILTKEPLIIKRGSAVYTDKCSFDFIPIGYCDEPFGRPTFKHRHQQFLHKHLKHSNTSRNTFASSQSSSPPSNISTHLFHHRSFSSSWNNKSQSRKSFAKLQPTSKSKQPLLSRSRSYFGKSPYHQNKNSTKNHNVEIIQKKTPRFSKRRLR